MPATPSPRLRVYLYETWHPLDDPQGWLQRLDDDLPRHWEGELLAKAWPTATPVVRSTSFLRGRSWLDSYAGLSKSGGLPGLSSREDLFAITENGTRDNIHINDLGSYLVALTHYAVLYHRSPVGSASPLVARRRKRC